ncbi:MAG TPA: HPr(Ser) kinase/phosphatase [Nitrospirota bacterium]|nr:HPr(Ser) kinase/phosphatase [Nitrospirota bacterium]
MKKIYVKDLLEACSEEMALTLAAGGKGRRPLLPEVQKVGLTLTGHYDNLDPRKIQVFGKTEMTYLRKLTREKRRRLLDALFANKAAAYVLTAGAEPLGEMLAAADKNSVPLITSPLETNRCIRGIIKVIEEMGANEVHLHGVLVDIMGVGVFIMGPSGIGKSECALELVVRGHRLVADDVVVIKKLSDGRLLGGGPAMIRYLMEVRGLGIVNVRDLFGISAIKAKKTLDMVVELVRWDEDESYERLGLDDQRYEIGGVRLPYMKIPVTPGRNIAVIVEVAARNHALKTQGMGAAAMLDRRLTRKLIADARENI